ncbi:MAG: hypothetical protein LBT98_01180 [Puniceicoccales bacterium]|jgi:hypothetical protein|nr:hypothetical protein [Puniceicoccales bacterium]
METAGSVEDFSVRIADARRRGRLPHALLLVGPDAAGARDFGEKIAKIFLPDSRSPDLFRLRPEGKMWQIGADPVREVRSQVQKTAHGTGDRLVLILEADRLHRAAANSLLKILEEPPAGVYFLLTTDRPGEIPATLRSRCSPCFCRESAPADLPPPLGEWVGDFRRFCQKIRSQHTVASQPARILDGYALIFRLRAILDDLCTAAPGDGDGEENRRRQLLATLAACGTVLLEMAMDLPEEEDRPRAIELLAGLTAALNRVRYLIAGNCPEMAALESVFFPEGDPISR